MAWRGRARTGGGGATTALPPLSSRDGGGVLKPSWLVQRLRRPWGHGKDNPFAFGGGRRDGGLSAEAMDLLRGVFSFDYMGSAEFEWGVVPEALTRVAQAKLCASSFKVARADVPPNPWSGKRAVLAEGDAIVYVLCPEQDREEVTERLRAWATQGDPPLHEPTHFTRALRPTEAFDGDTCGWLELDNGFFFFTDEEMWHKTCKLFGVET